MAFAQSAVPADRSGFSFFAFIERLRLRRAESRAYRQAVRELNALSDHQLRDIGIFRSQIHDVAIGILKR